MSLEPEDPIQNEPVLKSWNIDCKHIQSGGLVGKKEAGEEERQALCALLGLDSLIALTCDYDFAAYAKGRYALQCHFSAELKQMSVYSLDPIAQTINSEFSTELFKRRDDDEGGQFYLQNTLDGIEDIDKDFFDDEVIELGRLVYEFLSLELDGFAQDDGDAERWRKGNDAQVAAQKKKASPFAVLQGLSSDKKK